MRQQSAISRSGVLARTPATKPDAPSEDGRVHVSLAGLLALETQARRISFLPKQPAKSALNGRHASRIRGRGLDFEELRAYLPSDDVRSIDWKVTARTGTPFVRVYTEERDRPTLIVVDQRMSMFYGSTHAMKSVTAAQCAAIAAFRVLAQGDRVGGIVFGDETIADMRPKRSRASLTRFLTQLVQANQQLHAGAPDVTAMPINKVLRAVQKIATRDHLVILISDFDATDETTKRLLGGIARRNDVVLGFVTDPSLAALPKSGQITGSSGALQAELDLSTDQVRAAVLEVGAARVRRVMGWQNHMKLSILPLSSAQEALPQMVQLMGQVRR